MTECEWLACNDPEAMLEHLRGKASDRKLQLFCVACCRRIWHLLIDERSTNAVLVIERDADMMSRTTEIAIAFNESEIAFRACEHITARHADAAGAAHDLTASCDDMIAKAGSIALATANAAGYLDDMSFFACQADVEVEYPHQCSLIRDIFGNPFCTVTVEPSWLLWNNGTVVKMAEAVYNDRAFDRLPLLADALEDAGCQDTNILAHCREPESHVRGCWVVDLLLRRT